MVASDQQEALVLIAQLDMPTYALSGQLRLCGLDPTATYRVSVLDHPANFHQGLVNRQPQWTQEGIVLSGEWLQAVGLAMPVLDPTTAILLYLQRV